MISFARLLPRAVGELYEPEMDGTAYLRGYDHDIFVSYAHEEQLGEWNVRLHDELRKALNLIFYLKPPDPTFNVWIDEILRKNLPLSDALKTHVEGSALLIVVMSLLFALRFLRQGGGLVYLSCPLADRSEFADLHGACSGYE